MRTLGLLLLTSCFSKPPAPSVFADADGDAIEGADACPFGAWGTPQQVMGVADAVYDDLGAWLSPDGRELYFVRTSPPEHWIRRAHRDDPSINFFTPDPSPHVELQPYYGASPHLSDDELRLWVTRSSTGPNVTELVFATRLARDLAFDTPNIVTELHRGNYTQDATLSSDELTIVFASSGGALDLYTSVRDNPMSQWSTPVPLTGLNTGDADAQPSLSADGQYLLFVSGREPDGEYRIYEAQRQNPDDPSTFGSVQLFGPTSSMTSVGDPFISRDGKLVLFTSAPQRDLWFVQRACL